MQKQWKLFTKNGQCIAIPPDSFVFWGTLYEHILFSSKENTFVLWCFHDSDVCIGATIFDNDMWKINSNKYEISGQWRVIQNGTLNLLKEMEIQQFPNIQYPVWMQSLLKCKLTHKL